MAFPKDIKPGDQIEFETPANGMLGMLVDRIEPVEAYMLGNDSLGMGVFVLGDQEIRILPKGTKPRG